MIEVLEDLDGRLVVAPHGELCPLTVPRLVGCLHRSIDAGSRTIVVDLAGVTLLTAAGVNALVVVAERLDGLGGALVLRNATGLVARVLAITGADRYHLADAGSAARWN